MTIKLSKVYPVPWNRAIICNDAVAFNGSSNK